MKHRRLTNSVTLHRLPIWRTLGLTTLIPLAFLLAFGMLACRGRGFNQAATNNAGGNNNSFHFERFVVSNPRQENGFAVADFAVVENGIEKKIGKIERNPVSHYHWSQPAWVQKFATQGRIAPETMAAIVNPPMDGNMNGPGLYVSDNPFDSMSFGTRALVLLAPRNPPQALPGWFLRFDALTSTSLDLLWIKQALRFAGVSGISHFHNDTWKNVVSEAATAEVRELTAQDWFEFCEAGSRPCYPPEIVTIDGRYPLPPMQASRSAFLGPLLAGQLPEKLLAKYVSLLDERCDSFARQFANKRLAEKDANHAATEADRLAAFEGLSGDAARNFVDSRSETFLASKIRDALARNPNVAAQVAHSIKYSRCTLGQ